MAPSPKMAVGPSMASAAHAVVGAGSMVGADAVVSANAIVGADAMVAGGPAQCIVRCPFRISTFRRMGEHMGLRLSRLCCISLPSGGVHLVEHDSLLGWRRTTPSPHGIPSAPFFRNGCLLLLVALRARGPRQVPLSCYAPKRAGHQAREKRAHARRPRVPVRCDIGDRGAETPSNCAAVPCCHRRTLRC